mmetsp:Transcript_23494/g.35681  ORF Transcript_23494/g.35681 Transcript_23494/m.35681 type:complete len:98 (-) Transcript_23494:1291-1584(-)
MGMHARLGDVIIQDKAITVDKIKALHDVLETHWTEAFVNKDQNKMFDLSSVGAMSSVAFGSALRGEELAFVRLQVYRAHFQRPPPRPPTPLNCVHGR